MKELSIKKKQKPIEYPLCKTVKDKINYYIVNHFTTDTVVKTDVNSIVKAMEEGVMIGMSEQKPAWKPSDEMLEALYRVISENVMEKSEDEMLLDKLYQGLKYGKVLSEK